MLIVVAHLKCPSGHFLRPCNPQGRHSSFPFVSTIFELLANGPKPKLGIVEQNIAVVGASVAEAMCIGAESFT